MNSLGVGKLGRRIAAHSERSTKISTHSGLRFDSAHEAGLQKLGRDLLRRGGFQSRRPMSESLHMSRLEPDLRKVARWGLSGGVARVGADDVTFGMRC